jgi:hypothetical protein
MELRKITQQLLGGAAIFAAGVVSANTWLNAPIATAQQTKPATPPQAFLAADERTEPVIREILATIKKMDSRLENIEKSVTGGKKSTESGDSSRSRPR